MPPRSPFLPPPLPMEIPLDADLQRLLSLADIALGRFDGLLGSLPNPDLLLAPIMRREAVQSAQIEGSQSTVSDVLRFEAEGSAPTQDKRDDMREIVNYRNALAEAEKRLGEGYRFDLWLLRGLHGILLGGSARGGDKNPGAFRERQNWIGASGATMETATYIPPPPEKVAELMENWLAFWRENTGSPLVRMAVLHGQFEMIHPFMDGNGRVGRLLLPLFLFDAGVLKHSAFYLSAQLLKRRDEYYWGLRGLSESGEGWREWLRFFLETCAEQAEENIKTANRIKTLHEQLKRDAGRILHSRYAEDLADAIFNGAVFSCRALKFSGKRPADITLRGWVEKLAKAGVLNMARKGVRNRPAIYVFPPLLDI